MTNLANLSWSMANTFMYEACKSASLSGHTPGVIFMQTDEFQKRNRVFSLNSELPRILPFRYIHLLLCLVSHRLFILAFISAITAMPVRSLRGK